MVSLAANSVVGAEIFLLPSIARPRSIATTANGAATGAAATGGAAAGGTATEGTAVVSGSGFGAGAGGSDLLHAVTATTLSASRARSARRERGVALLLIAL